MTNKVYIYIEQCGQVTHHIYISIIYWEEVNLQPLIWELSVVLARTFLPCLLFSSVYIIKFYYIWKIIINFNNKLFICFLFIFYFLKRSQVPICPYGVQVGYEITCELIPLTRIRILITLHATWKTYFVTPNYLN